MDDLVDNLDHDTDHHLNDGVYHGVGEPHLRDHDHQGHDGHHDHASHHGLFSFEAFKAWLPWDEHGHLDLERMISRFDIGHPEGDHFTHQTTGFTCAVVSQKMILDAFHIKDHQTGEPISESRLVFDATSNGWLTGHGTALHDIGNLLEHHGLSMHHGQDWHHLLADLAKGHQVVIAVDSSALWHPEAHHSSLFDLTKPCHHGVDHAIVLKGLRVDPFGHVEVVVNDPGQHSGSGVAYSLEQFETATGLRHIAYVATNDAPPDWVAEPAHEILSRLIGLEIEMNQFVNEPTTNPLTFGDSLDHMMRSERETFIRNL